MEQQGRQEDKVGVRSGGMRSTEFKREAVSLKTKHIFKEVYHWNRNFILSS